MALEVPSIGSMRSPITVVRLVQTPDATTGMITTDEVRATAHAEIIPVGAVAFYAGMAVDSGYSHRIRTRYLHGLDQRDEIRSAYTLADGTPVVDRYKVLRVKPLDQKRRHIEIEASIIVEDFV